MFHNYWASYSVGYHSFLEGGCHIVFQLSGQGWLMAAACGIPYPIGTNCGFFIQEFMEFGCSANSLCVWAEVLPWFHYGTHYHFLIVSTFWKLSQEQKKFILVGSTGVRSFSGEYGWISNTESDFHTCICKCRSCWAFSSSINRDWFRTTIGLYDYFMKNGTEQLTEWRIIWGSWYLISTI